LTAYVAAIPRLRRGGSGWHRLAALLAVVPAVFLVASLAAPAFAAGDYGPDTCLEGYVWREATPADHVCVTGTVRTQTANDNSQAAARRSPTGGAYGPDTCLFGYVWREAVAGDHVCVTGATRSQAASDNSQAAARRGSLNTWHTTYTIPPVCSGDICTTNSTDDIPRFRLQGDHIDVGWVLVELRRADTGALRQSWLTYASPALVVPGGRFSLDTSVIDCAHGYDSYFRVQDPSSRRWSTPHYVSAVCAVL
jgi:hypothetical protein